MTNETPGKAPRKVKLTGMQRVFVKHMVGTGDKAYAAHKAGYADPAVAGNKLMYKSHVRESVYAEQMRRLEVEGMPAAVDRLLSTIRDDTKPVGAQVNASKIVLDANHKRQETDNRDKELNELTGPELAALAREAGATKQIIERMLEGAEDAQAVEIEPEQPTDAGVFG